MSRVWIVVWWEQGERQHIPSSKWHQPHQLSRRTSRVRLPSMRYSMNCKHFQSHPPRLRARNQVSWSINDVSLSISPFPLPSFLNSFFPSLFKLVIITHIPCRSNNLRVNCLVSLSCRDPSSISAPPPPPRSSSRVNDQAQQLMLLSSLTAAALASARNAVPGPATVMRSNSVPVSGHPGHRAKSTPPNDNNCMLLNQESIDSVDLQDAVQISDSIHPWHPLTHRMVGHDSSYWRIVTRSCSRSKSYFRINILNFSWSLVVSKDFLTISKRLDLKVTLFPNPESESTLPDPCPSSFRILRKPKLSLVTRLRRQGHRS